MSWGCGGSHIGSEFHIHTDSGIVHVVNWADTVRRIVMREDMAELRNREMHEKREILCQGGIGTHVWSIRVPGGMLYVARNAKSIRTEYVRFSEEDRDEL